MDFVPAAIARERESFGAYAVRTMGGNLLADLVQAEVRQRERIVAIDDEAVLMAPYASRVPYHLILAPRASRPRFEAEGPSGAALLYDALRRLKARLGASPPLNLWVRTAPSGAEHFCWRIEIMPRLTYLAGLELGSGVNLCILPPEQAAAELARRVRAATSAGPAGARASTVDGTVTGAIGPGLLVLLGVTHADTERDADRIAEKIRALRVFGDADGKMNEALGDREVLCVSQFTLYGDTRKGNRPAYVDAARPEVAEPLYERVCERLDAQRGVFGAHMDVELVNDGPVTVMIEVPVGSAPMPPVERPVCRFAAEPPQAALPHGRWADTLQSEFMAACLRIEPEDDDDVGTPGTITWFPDRTGPGAPTSPPRRTRRPGWRSSATCPSRRATTITSPASSSRGPTTRPTPPSSTRSGRWTSPRRRSAAGAAPRARSPRSRSSGACR